MSHLKEVALIFAGGKRAGWISLFQKQLTAHPTSCPVKEEGSLLGDIACGESYKALLILDAREDFKTVYKQNIQSVGRWHLAARNSNKLKNQ
jgi:hypothetical protein